MEKLLFGASGLPLGDGTKKYDYASGIEHIKSIGLDAMELLFVHSVNVTEKNYQKILRSKTDNGIYLSAHGSYYINLNSGEAEKQEQSLERINKAAAALSSVEGRSLVFHPGFYGSRSKEESYAIIKANLQKLPSGKVSYRLETTGSVSQFGTLEELVSLCREIPYCKLCIDFAHIHARYNGCLKGYKDFTLILEYVLANLGRAALDDLHIHMAGIEYNSKGEKRHLPILESDFKYMDCLKALKDFDVKGCVIAEGPLVEKEALFLKNEYEKL